ncbi:MAG TPA: hypothetical protein VGJ13_07790 [Pseudonocardiaceae bacterium]|jgi:hypothetical protein
MPTPPPPESAEDLETSISDVVRTGQIVTTAQWIVASVVMGGSALSAGYAFGHFHEPFYMGFIIGLAVDTALASWLLISRKLRATGVKTAWGPVLEGITALMTLCLNSGSSMLDGNYALAGAHAFLPVVLFVLSMAGGEAQHKLHDLLKKKEAAEAARKRQADDDERIRSERATREHHETTRTENNRRTAEATKAAKEAEKETEAHKASVTVAREENEAAVTMERERNETALTVERERSETAATLEREAREHATQKSVRELSGLILMSTTMRVVAMTAAGLNGTGQSSRQYSAIPRQGSVSPAGSPASPARVASGSPAPSPARRQPASPARRQPPPASPAQVAPDLAKLVTLAKQELATSPGMGRPTLAKRLAERSGDHVTDHMVKTIRRMIDDEQRELLAAEVAGFLSAQ